jgi:hypothetical protein
VNERCGGDGGRGVGACGALAPCRVTPCVVGVSPGSDQRLSLVRLARRGSLISHGHGSLAHSLQPYTYPSNKDVVLAMYNFFEKYTLLWYYIASITPIAMLYIIRVWFFSFYAVMYSVYSLQSVRIQDTHHKSYTSTKYYTVDCGLWGVGRGRGARGTWDARDARAQALCATSHSTCHLPANKTFVSSYVSSRDSLGGR